MAASGVGGASGSSSSSAGLLALSALTDLRDELAKFERWPAGGSGTLTYTSSVGQSRGAPATAAAEPLASSSSCAWPAAPPAFGASSWGCGSTARSCQDQSISDAVDYAADYLHGGELRRSMPLPDAGVPGDSLNSSQHQGSWHSGMEGAAMRGVQMAPPPLRSSAVPSEPSSMTTALCRHWTPRHLACCRTAEHRRLLAVSSRCSSQRWAAPTQGSGNPVAARRTQRKGRR
mmetsp:Transcript_139879/g.447359  ORF Transcript_139879/g.447359 Transcript_139879/m.447359 type:complete len:232 (-) Transcript_139879:652-1347(-)